MKPETSKFCAGRTIDARKVESIGRIPKSATTGTPAAFTAKPGVSNGGGFGFWMAFAAVAFAFGVAFVEDVNRATK